MEKGKKNIIAVVIIVNNAHKNERTGEKRSQYYSFLAASQEMG
jgi:hypothetical protein